MLRCVIICNSNYPGGMHVTVAT